MCLSPVGRPRLEELSFSENQPFSFSTFNPGELGVEKFSWRSFHLVPDGIHPLVANSRCVGFSTSALLRLRYLGYTALLTSALLRVNPFSSFHSPCSPQQNGVSHILHVQGLPIGSFFLSPLSHSRRNLAPWRRCDYP